MQLKLGSFQRSTNAHWKIKRQCSASAQDISIWWVGVRGRSMTTWKRKGRWSKNALLCPRLCPIHVVCFSLISNLLPNLISDLISDFGTASMLNYTIRSLITKFMVWLTWKLSPSLIPNLISNLTSAQNWLHTWVGQQSAPNNSNETYTFTCLGRASRFGQH